MYNILECIHIIESHLLLTRVVWTTIYTKNKESTNSSDVGDGEYESSRCILYLQIDIVDITNIIDNILQYSSLS